MPGSGPAAGAGPGALTGHGSVQGEELAAVEITPFSGDLPAVPVPALQAAPQPGPVVHRGGGHPVMLHPVSPGRHLQAPLAVQHPDIKPRAHKGGPVLPLGGGMLRHVHGSNVVDHGRGQEQMRR